MQIQTIKQAESIVGRLSGTSKMPCKSTNLPASACRVGSYLAVRGGTTCSDCYAFKGNYQFSNVQAALHARLENLYHAQWVPAMAYLIERQSPEYFRWHDSGDLQSLQHLANIVSVAQLTPNCQHWLPTREFGIVFEYKRLHGEFPANLTVRLSMPKIDSPAPKAVGNGSGLVYSTVFEKQAAPGQVCPAPKQDNTCGSCRACWSKDVPVISYHKH